jgi:hypothetical protein
VGTIYDPSELPGVSIVGPGIGRGVTYSLKMVDSSFLYYKWIKSVGTLNQGYPLLQYEDAVHVQRLQATRGITPDPSSS